MNEHDKLTIKKFIFQKSYMSETKDKKTTYLLKPKMLEALAKKLLSLSGINVDIEALSTFKESKDASKKVSSIIQEYVETFNYNIEQMSTALNVLQDFENYIYAIEGMEVIKRTETCFVFANPTGEFELYTHPFMDYILKREIDGNTYKFPDDIEKFFKDLKDLKIVKVS